MNKKIQQIILFLGIISGFFLKADFVSALEVHYPTILGHSLNSTSSFGDYVCYLFGLGMNLAILTAVAIVAFGGVYYLVSYGRGKFTSEAKDWIKAGVLGLLIIVCSSLIAYTINPALTNCKFGILSLIPSLPYTNTNTTPLGVNITTYKEIPMGVLTENLLTRTMDCYGFDQSGNPVDGDLIETIGNQKIYGPTYMDHDRADCLTQLTDGAQKKANVIAVLSEEITKSMNSCSCEGKCDPVCDPAKGGCQTTQCPGGTCTGACVGGACRQPPNTTDCCPAGVKDKIEHGPISITVNVGGTGGILGDCKTQSAEYKGLDEFRCPNPNNKNTPCSNMANFVEKQIQVGDKSITVVDQDNWKKINLIQQLTYFKEKIDEIKQKIQKDKDVLDQAKKELGHCYLAIPSIDFLKTYETTNRKQNIILTDKTFSDPQTGSTIDASKYCTGFNYDNSSCLKKCNDMCPDASSQAIKLYQDKTSSCMENDPAYTACLEKSLKDAYNLRPCIYGTDTSQNFGDCITSCQNSCSDNCAKKYLACSDEYDLCQNQCKNNSQCVLDNAGSCLFDAKNFQQCANKSNTNDQANTSFCISNAYLCKSGSDEYAGYLDCAEPSAVKCSSFFDQKNCENSTQCIWDGKKCLQNYSASFFYDNKNSQKCPTAYSPPLKNSVCYSKSEKCSAVSNQTSCNALSGCTWDNGTCSASTSCQDLCPETTKCPSGSACPNCPCDQLNDPSNPDKPLTLNFSIPNISVSDKSDPGYNLGDEGYTTEEQKVSAHEIVSPQCNGYSYNNDPLTFYCENNWWNDPNREGLSQIPIGTERTCPKSGEVPVGQTVDNAENWAGTLINNADGMNKDIQNIIDLMVKIGGAKDNSTTQGYCKCNSKLENGDPICKTGCQYIQNWVKPVVVPPVFIPAPTTPTTPEETTPPTNETTPPQEESGGGGLDYNNPAKYATVSLISTKTNNEEFLNAQYTKSMNKNTFLLTQNDQNGTWTPGYTIPGYYSCSCTFIPCKGNPCQQITDYFSQLWNNYRQLKLNFIDFYTTMIKEPRSDIMKELTYSRQATNICSLASSVYGIGARMLDCTRVEDELISPINTNEITKDELSTLINISSDQIKLDNGKNTIDGYCYGKELGDLFKESLTDNWFCCQEYSGNPTTSNNPIYNTENIQK
jgi:hypothetical protein